MVAELTLWLAILLGGLGTYLTRLSFIVLIPQDRLPEAVRRGLRFIPTAVLSAIVLPELVIHQGELDLSLGNDRLLAGLAAALVAWRLRSAWLTIGAGMLALLVLSRL